ncbi:MAG TPA: hypothetical protein VKU87_06195 [Thermomicrobiaceae bacterium]|nr:hypothetical protein [Thermomicrobiaceae bacterium]
MAVTNERFDDRPRLDVIRQDDWPEAEVWYDDLSDTLIVRLDPARVTTSVPIGDYEYLLVDPVDEQVVGVQIEYYLEAAVQEHPKWLELAQFADISPQRLAAARARIDEARIRQIALRDLLREVVAKVS